jgi:hypothetical protein
MNRSALGALAVACAVALTALALNRPAQAQGEEERPVGRFQISTIPGAVYMLDTTTGDLYVREYQTKNWRKAGNPLTDAR